MNGTAVCSELLLADNARFRAGVVFHPQVHHSFEDSVSCLKRVFLGKSYCLFVQPVSDLITTCLATMLV